MATSNETATYIGDLPTSPTIPSDTSAGGRSRGGAEIRKTKKIMKDTFPNVDGAVNATDTEMETLVGVTSGIQGQLNGKAATAHTHTVSNISDLTADATALNLLTPITAINADLTTGTPAATELADAAAIAALVAAKNVIKQIAYGSFSDDNVAGGTWEDLLSVTFPNSVQAGSTVLAFGNVNYIAYANGVNVSFDITDSSDVSVLPGSEAISTNMSNVYTPNLQSLVAFAQDTSPATGSTVSYKLRQAGSTSIAARNGSLILVEFANDDP